MARREKCLKSGHPARPGGCADAHALAGAVWLLGSTVQGAQRHAHSAHCRENESKEHFEAAGDALERPPWHRAQQRMSAEQYLGVAGARMQVPRAAKRLQPLSSRGLNQPVRLCCARELACQALA